MPQCSKRHCLNEFPYRSVFSSIGDEMIAQFKTDVVTALEGFELEINCKSVPTENFDKFAVVKVSINLIAYVVG